MTVVEDVQDVSAGNAQAPAAIVIKTCGSRRPRLSLEEKREIARLYADTSASTSEICARLGIGESSLYRIVQLQGLPLRGRTASSTSPTTTQPAPARYTSRNRSSNAGRHLVLKPDSAAGTSGGAVRDRAIASEMKQTPESSAQATVAPIAGGAKNATRRRRTPTEAGQRPRVKAPIVSPAANSAPVPIATRRSRMAGAVSPTKLGQFVVTFAVEQTLVAVSVLDALHQAQTRGATEVTSIVRIAD